MTLDEAVQNITEALKDFENQTPEMQTKLRSTLKEIGDLIAQSETRQREIKQAEAKRRRQQYADRKERIREFVPQWCEENLEPGMIIKVKAKNSGWRRVLNVKPARVLSNGFRIEGEVRTQHVYYKRTRNPETRELSWSLQDGDYITNHTLTNVQGVVLRTDSRGEPIVTSVLELAEGANENELDSNK